MGIRTCLITVLSLFASHASSQEIPLSLHVGRPFVFVLDASNQIYLGGEVTYQSSHWWYLGVATHVIAYEIPKSGHFFIENRKIKAFEYGVVAGIQVPLSTKIFQRAGLCGGFETLSTCRNGESQSFVNGQTKTSTYSHSYVVTSGYAGFNLNTFYKSNTGFAAGLGLNAVVVKEGTRLTPFILLCYYFPMKRSEALPPEK